MKQFIPALLIFLVCFAAPHKGAAQAESSRNKSDRHKIHVITIGPGEELFGRFGHIAMLVEDRQRGTNTVYNYGTFNFSDPKLRIKYARGFLNYWLSTAPLNAFLSFYDSIDRDAWLSTLNLTPAEATTIARALEENTRPENRHYAYRHYLDNCCTRIRDVIDTNTGNSISSMFKSVPVERDFRYWTDTSLDGYLLYKNVILYSLGPEVDRDITRWDEQFLPSVFHEDLKKVKLKDGRPLVAFEKQILFKEGPPIGENTPLVDILVVGSLGLLLLIGLGAFLVPGNRAMKARNRLLGMGLLFWSLLAGLGGTMLLLYWTATTHYDTHYNENLLINPFTHLWLVGPAFKLLFKGTLGRRTSNAIRWYLLASLVLIAADLLLKVGPFIQSNYGTIAIATTCNLMVLFSLRKNQLVDSILPDRQTK